MAVRSKLTLMALTAVAYAAVFTVLQPARAEVRYSTHKELSDGLKQLAEGPKELVRVKSVARSRQTNEVWLVEVGSGPSEERARRPALLLVAGIEGNDLAGTAVAMAWLKDLAANYQNNSKIKTLLDSSTIYVFPRLNPDATEFFFRKPKIELEGNLVPVDDDHDGLVDEDGPDDLDGDGLITWMRVEDPDGEYILDPSEPRLLLKADRKKGERGAWRFFTEGLDNDHDEAWNEDGPGGVNLNRNFPYNYKYFAPSAGVHQVSEAETRALADFVVAHPNIGVVFTFGAADNLVQTPKGEAPKRPPTAIQEEDIVYYREFGKAWRETLELKKEIGGITAPGSFSDWIYFHRGRLSLAARPWSPALQLELAKQPSGKEKPKEEGADAAAKAPKAKLEKPDEAKKLVPENKGEPDPRNEEDRNFFKWLDENAPESFVPWKPYQHPDFPGKRVEVGGFAPFAKTNPPEKLLEQLATKETSFLTALAGKLPRIGIRKVTVKPLGKSIFDVTVQIENTGFLPTSLAQGSLTGEVYPTRVVMKIEPKTLLSGSKTTMVGAIEGNGGTKEVRYIINAEGKKEVNMEVVSMLGGSVQKTIALTEEK